MHPVSCTITYHDIIDFVNCDMVKNTKTGMSCERSITFLKNKNILNLCTRLHILRRYHFVADVTLNIFNLETCKE